HLAVHLAVNGAEDTTRNDDYHRRIHSGAQSAEQDEHLPASLLRGDHFARNGRPLAFERATMVIDKRRGTA
ncbi:hypothetical protein ISCGN_006040, partial [Ixodes scapularis]